MQAPSKNREEGRALALGGRRLMMANNIQPASGRSGRGDVRAEARWAGSLWGDTMTSYGASNGVAIKNNMKYTMALNGRRLIILHTTTNQKQAAAMEGSMKGR